MSEEKKINPEIYIAFRTVSFLYEKGLADPILRDKLDRNWEAPGIFARVDFTGLCRQLSSDGFAGGLVIEEFTEEMLRKVCCIMELLCQRYDQKVCEDVFIEPERVRHLNILWSKIGGNMARFISVLGIFKENLLQWADRTISSQTIEDRYNSSSTPFFCKMISAEDSRPKPPGKAPVKTIAQISALLGTVDDMTEEVLPGPSPSDSKNGKQVGMRISSTGKQKPNLGNPVRAVPIKNLAQIQGMLPK